jgi:hypothetical protein
MINHRYTIKTEMHKYDNPPLWDIEVYDREMERAMFYTNDTGYTKIVKYDMKNKQFVARFKEDYESNWGDEQRYPERSEQNV